MSDPSNLRKAQFRPAEGGEPIPVHFNPESLKITITNTLQNQGSGDATKQYVSQSSAKLALELVFDTTDTGRDVMGDTARLASLMAPRPASGSSNPRKVPQVVVFEWGAYSFQGMIDSYTETVDFFSADGVPLRSSVSLGMSKQDQVFQEGGGGGPGTSTSPAVNFPTASGQGVSQAASSAGNPGAARAIAQQNGLESLRDAAGGDLLVAQGRNFKGPAGISAGLNLSVGAGASGSSTLSAFAGLRAQAGASASARLDLELGASAEAQVSQPGTVLSAKLGGQIQGGTSSLRADVGGVNLKTKLSFDEGG